VNTGRSALSDRDAALLEWAGALGKDHVIADPPSLAAAQTATFATAQSVPAILRPASREEVQQCLRIANRRRVPVYPTSSGKNWGYGSRVPVMSAVLLDLSRMNRILDFSEELGYVTVEPGVTQAQLYSYLRDRQSNLWMDATGASPDSSLIGNTMERGFGHTPYSDHLAHACDFEVVLPTGECVQTGLSRFAGAKAGRLYRGGWARMWRDCSHSPIWESSLA
jgi:4-cresol dehydrogenase (hydroxylating) flavoprotein subunit